MSADSLGADNLGCNSPTDSRKSTSNSRAPAIVFGLVASILFAVFVYRWWRGEVIRTNLEEWHIVPKSVRQMREMRQAEKEANNYNTKKKVVVSEPAQAQSESTV